MAVLATARSGMAPADLTRALTEDPDTAVKVAVLLRVLGGQLREADAAGLLTFAHGALQGAAAHLGPSDSDLRVARILASDDVWDDTDAREAVWHSITAAGSSSDSGRAESTPVLARALNRAPTGQPQLFKEAMHRVPEGINLVADLADAGLNDRGLGVLLIASDTDGRYVLPQARVDLSEVSLALARSLADPRSPGRTVMHALSNFADNL